MPIAYETVDEYLADQADDRRAMIEAARAIVLESRPDLVEHLRWNAPSYLLDDEDRATFSSRPNAPLRLVLNPAAGVRATKRAAPAFDGDPRGLLSWHSNVQASIGFADLAQIEAERDDVLALLRAWFGAADAHPVTLP